MTPVYKTPGVYIEERNAFPNSVVAVATDVPVFIGYTEKAEFKGKSLLGNAYRINSLLEYFNIFGYGYKHVFDIAHSGNEPLSIFQPSILSLRGKRFYLYDCLRLFYQNGGSACYIFSLGEYGKGHAASIEIDSSDVTRFNMFKELEKLEEPTMVLMPDFVSLPSRFDCYQLYRQVLEHCNVVKSRMGIFDVIPSEEDAGVQDTVQLFREAIGTEYLSYGAAYYPWLNTALYQLSDVDFTFLNINVTDLKSLLPEPEVVKLFADWKVPDENNTVEEKVIKFRLLHQALIKISPVYQKILNEICKRLNLLPPSAAMAGIYTMIDNSRGVWKAPANVGLTNVYSLSVNITNQEQEKMNADLTGKSVNAIRMFPGQGMLVWGARTLDGNSREWRYINVRRTMMMIEQSLQLAVKAYVFEPNNTNTWTTIKGMIENFLNSLWKQGALAGAKPDEAFSVKLGLGATMTAQDIADGLLRVTVMVALLRPAEFMVISFSQQQQQA